MIAPSLISLILATASSLAVAAIPAPPGVVIDHSPVSSRQYIGSPGIAILPDGELVASHDLFGPGSTTDTTVVFSSSDKGSHWQKRAELKGQWWSTLFVHNNALYLFGVTKEYGACVIRRSIDGGKTWTTPTNAQSGLLLSTGMYHCAPVPVIVHNGRIWRAMEEYTGPTWGKFKAFMMSAPENADLLNASSWTSTNRIGPGPDWLNGTATAVLEGNAVVTPEGTVTDILRVHQPNFDEVAARMHVNADGTQMAFDPKADFIKMPGGSKKFTIRWDATSKRYWSLVNYIPAAFHAATGRPDQVRNTLALVSSKDLESWTVNQIIIQERDTAHCGFQYVDWLFDGKDIIAAIRTAYPEKDGTPAHNFHDANWLLFKRIKGFRKLAQPTELPNP